MEVYVEEIITGSGFWYTPTGVTEIIVECIGGGGSGSSILGHANSVGSGGAGGAYARITMNTSHGQYYSYYCGQGGANWYGGKDGEGTWFGSQENVFAQGGQGATDIPGPNYVYVFVSAYGSADRSIGELVIPGGDGGGSLEHGESGGGGAAAAPGGMKGDAYGRWGGNNMIGYPFGEGGSGLLNSVSTGGPGGSFGGGGGGGSTYGNSGGVNVYGGIGGSGAIRISYWRRLSSGLIMRTF